MPNKCALHKHKLFLNTSISLGAGEKEPQSPREGSRKGGGRRKANIFYRSRLNGGKDASWTSHRDKGEEGAVGSAVRL